MSFLSEESTFNSETLTNDLKISNSNSTANIDKSIKNMKTTPNSKTASPNPKTTSPVSKNTSPISKKISPNSKMISPSSNTANSNGTSCNSNISPNPKRSPPSYKEAVSKAQETHIKQNKNRSKKSLFRSQEAVYNMEFMERYHLLNPLLKMALAAYSPKEKITKDLSKKIASAICNISSCTFLTSSESGTFSTSPTCNNSTTPENSPTRKNHLAPQNSCTSVNSCGLEKSCRSENTCTSENACIAANKFTLSKTLPPKDLNQLSPTSKQLVIAINAIPETDYPLEVPPAFKPIYSWLTKTYAKSNLLAPPPQQIIGSVRLEHFIHATVTLKKAYEYDNKYLAKFIQKSPILFELLKQQKFLYRTLVLKAAPELRKKHTFMKLPVKIGQKTVVTILFDVTGRVQPTTLTLPRFMALIHREHFLSNQRNLTPLIGLLDASKMDECFQKILPLLGPGFHFQAKFLFEYDFSQYTPKEEDPYLGHKLYWLGLHVLDYMVYINLRRRESKGKKLVVYFSPEMFVKELERGKYESNRSAGIRHVLHLDEFEEFWDCVRIESMTFIWDNMKNLSLSKKWVDM